MIANTKKVKDEDFNIKRSADEVRNLSFKNHICIGCGKCEFTCPVDAITVADMGPIVREEVDQPKIEIDEDKCVLCGMCSGICPVNALEFTIDGEPISTIEEYPHYIASAEIDDDECIHCQRCEIACPREAITIARSLPERANLVTGEIEVDEETCIHCGICDEMCPADAIEVDRTPGAESIKVDKDKCVYCLICKKSCPVNAIKAACRSCSYGEYDINPEDAVTTGSSFIDDELCVKCGWCEEICPVDAAKVKKQYEGTLTVDEEKCTVCGTCIDVCPCNVLSFPESPGPATIIENINVDEEFCIHCGACERACPVDAIDVEITDVDYTPTKSKSWKEKFEALKTK